MSNEDIYEKMNEEYKNENIYNDINNVDEYDRIYTEMDEVVYEEMWEDMNKIVEETEIKYLVESK